MLLELHIDNIALIERLRIEFGQGLNVLTGETGAGKSIVVDCLGLVLGGRAERDMIRTGEEKACVRALFDVARNASALSFLDEIGAEAQDGLVEITRELSRSGKNICRVNGALIPLNKLKSFTGLLVDIHGQHEHQALMDTASHLRFLDAFGDARHQALIDEVARVYGAYRETARELDKLKMDASERARRTDMLAFQAREIAAAKLKPGEEEALAQKAKLYENAEKIATQLRSAYERVYLGGKNMSAQESVKRAADAMKSIASIDERFANIATRLEELYYAAQDIGYELQDAVETCAFDPVDAEKIGDRLDLIKRLERKYGPELSDVIAFGTKAEAELKQLESSEDTILALTEQLNKQEKEMNEACDALTRARDELARGLCAKVVDQLKDLGMERAQFEAQFIRLKQPQSDGADQMEFLLTPNPGEPLKPLASVASGGELSRVMLALKAISAESVGVDTMIFDEIDTGVSGRMAQTVGEKMCMLGKDKQVLCVTHLAQIAALGDTHFLVEKTVKNDRAGSSVVKLDEDGRVKELSRLVSGADDSASGIDHARRMLSAAAALKARRFS